MLHGSEKNTISPCHLYETHSESGNCLQVKGAG
jgi:hypothetical protein